MPEHACKDFRCNTREFCIHPDLVCDGVNHCGDGSDEVTSTICQSEYSNNPPHRTNTRILCSKEYCILCMTCCIECGSHHTLLHIRFETMFDLNFLLILSCQTHSQTKTRARCSAWSSRGSSWWQLAAYWSCVRSLSASLSASVDAANEAVEAAAPEMLCSVCKFEYKFVLYSFSYIYTELRFFFWFHLPPKINYQ